MPRTLMLDLISRLRQAGVPDAAIALACGYQLSAMRVAVSNARSMGVAVAEAARSPKAVANRRSESHAALANSGQLPDNDALFIVLEEKSVPKMRARAQELQRSRHLTDNLMSPLLAQLDETEARLARRKAA